MGAGALPPLVNQFVAGATTVGAGALATGAAVLTVAGAAVGTAFARYEDGKYEDGKYENGDYTNTAKIGMVIQDGIDLFNNGVNSIKTFATDRLEMSNNPAQGTGTNSTNNSTQRTGGNNGKPCGSKTGAVLGVGTGAGLAGSNFLGEEQGLEKSVVQGASVLAGIAGGACDPISTIGGTAVAGTGVGLYVKLDSQDKTIKKLQDQIKEQQPTTTPTTSQTTSPTTEQTPTSSPEPTTEPTPTASPEVPPEPATPPTLNN
jgi:hypothetical protein